MVAALQPRVIVVIVPVRLRATGGRDVRRGVSPWAVRCLFSGPFLVMLLFVAESDGAWQVRTVPGVTLGAEYSDNVTASAGDKIEDAVLVATPSLSWRLDREDLRFEGRSALRVERYLDNGDLDGEDPSHRLGATWRLNERWTLSASDEWRESRNLDDLIEAGEIVVQRELRTTNEAQATLTWLATERATLSVTYTNYNSQSDDPSNSDYLLHSVSINGSLGLTERLGFFAGANVQDYDFSPSLGDPARRRTFTRNYAVSGGAGYQFSERLEAQLQLGARHTEQTTRAVALDVTTFPIGFVEIEETSGSVNGTFSGRATYALERGSISFSASQDLTATAGAEGTVERRTFALNARNGFAADWEWSAGVTSSSNKTDTGLAATERDTRSLSYRVGLSYHINDYLDAQFRVRRLDFQDDARTTDVERHSALVTLTARWPHNL
jgi:hypothetical protein